MTTMPPFVPRWVLRTNSSCAVTAIAVAIAMMATMKRECVRCCWNVSGCRDRMGSETNGGLARLRASAAVAFWAILILALPICFVVSPCPSGYYSRLGCDRI